MPQNNPDFTFPIPTLEEWLEVARQELDGVDPLEKLSVLKGTLKIKPYYTSIVKNPIQDFDLKPATNPFYGARSWMNTPRITVEDEKIANRIALDHLNAGADGIVFEPRKPNLQFDTLFNQIKPEYCALSLLIRNDFPAYASDFSAWTSRNGMAGSLTGSFFWESAPTHVISSIKKYSTLGIIVDPQKNAEDEIAMALQKAIVTLDSYTQQGNNINDVIEQFAFSVSTGTDFFLEIAKLKSLRNLWYQVQGAYGIVELKPVHIHATSAAWISEEIQPHGNMIKSTMSALAAIMGGCDSLTIEPEDYNNEMMKRVARNVSSILREESHLAKVADPVAGSYYLDSLIAELSEKAWQKFQLLTA